MLKSLSLIVLVLFSTHSFSAELVNLANCGVQTDSEPKVFSDDFNWGMDLAQIKTKEASIYDSGKRLGLRAFVKDGQAYFPHKSSFGPNKLVKITEGFLKSVQKHVETAFKFHYIDALIFPDMGHSHFFIPKHIYDRDIGPINGMDKMMEAMIALPELKILYHTAEQLTMLDEDKKLLANRDVQWRFYTRNLVGDNKGLGRMQLLHNKESSHNTAHDFDEDHRYWGAGFNISASKNGCFSYQRDGKTMYFDLSLYDLEPSTVSDDDYSGDMF